MSGVLLQPGNNPAVSPTNDANLPVSAEMISKGGFASLTLNNLKSGSYLTFADNTTVSLPGQLVINNIGTIIVPNGVVGTLQANYVQWNGALGQFSITSASNVTVGPGLQTFVISQPLPLAGLFGPGDTVTFTDNSNSANTMSGTVASYDAKTGRSRSMSPVPRAPAIPAAGSSLPSATARSTSLQIPSTSSAIFPCWERGRQPSMLPAMFA